MEGMGALVVVVEGDVCDSLEDAVVDVEEDVGLAENHPLSSSTCLLAKSSSSQIPFPSPCISWPSPETFLLPNNDWAVIPLRYILHIPFVSSCSSSLPF